MDGRPHACPVCGATILWCDGEATPGLVFRADDARPLVAYVIGCERCVAQRAARLAPTARAPIPPLSPRRPRETRPVRQIMQDDTRAVVDLFADGLEVVGKAAEWLRRLKG